MVEEKRCDVAGADVRAPGPLQPQLLHVRTLEQRLAEHLDAAVPQQGAVGQVDTEHGAIARAQPTDRAVDPTVKLPLQGQRKLCGALAHPLFRSLLCGLLLDDLRLWNE